MYRIHRFASFASFFLLASLLVGFALGSGSSATAGEGATAVQAAVSAPTPVVSTDPNVVKELVEKRTENSRTFLLKDGRLKSEVFDGPINYQDAAGYWREINTTLASTPRAGEYVSTATPVRVTVNSPGSSADQVTLEAQGAKVGMTMEGTSLSAPMVTGSKALYLSPSSNLFLSYESLGDGLKETISLLVATCLNTFTFTVSHPGLTMWQDHTGQWGLYEMIEYPPVLVMGGLSVFDSSLSALGDPAFCADATMTVTPGQDKSTITIAVPQKWLTDPAREFPVKVDPSWSTRSSADTYVATNPGGSSYGSLAYMSVGYSSGVKYRSFVKFNLTTLTDFQGSYVQDAQLYLHQYWLSTTTPKKVRAAQMTKAWSESSTYNSLGTYDLAYAKETQQAVGQPPLSQDVTFQFPEVGQYWADGGPNNGFCIYTEQYETDHCRKFDTRECTTVANRPKLTLIYTPPLDVTTYGANGHDSPAMPDDPADPNDDPDEYDDTGAFQAAIDAVDPLGGVVKVPAGDYYISGLRVDRSNLILKGLGTSSVLLPMAPDQDHMIHIGASCVVSNITVKDLYLRLPAAGDGIQVSGTGGGSGITLTGLSMAAGADSEDHQAISCDEHFSNVTVRNNDLSSVTAVPLDLSRDVAQLTVNGNNLNQAYQADFFRGTNRYETAVRMSKEAFPSALPAGSAVVIVPGDTYCLAVLGAPLAKAWGGPVLYTESTALTPVVIAELQRLQPAKVFTIGLSDTVSGQVLHALPGLSDPATLVKITGTNAFDVAAKVAVKVKDKAGTPGKVVIIPSDDLSGIAAVPLAAQNGWPILLTPKYGMPPDGTLPTFTSDCYTSLGVTSAVEVGTSVSLPGIPFPDRLIGTDFYGLAASVANYAASNNCSFLHTGLARCPATGMDFPDALAMAAYLAKDGGILLLTEDTTVPAATMGKLENHNAAIDFLEYVGAPTLWKQAENSLIWVPGAVRHTTYDLGQLAGHGLVATLDQKRLEMTATDLQIASFGPRAALDRVYWSSRMEPVSNQYFSQGWYFGFERRLDLTMKDGEDTGWINYIDGAGEIYWFYKKGSGWVTQPGYTGGLRSSEHDYKLTLPSSNTLTFDENGRLESEKDSNGNVVTYAWDASGHIQSITAANGQQIIIQVDANGKLIDAAYSAGGQTRTVDYTTTSTSGTVTYLEGQGNVEHSVTYGYTAAPTAKLSELTITSFAGGEDSTETFSYTSDTHALIGVQFPDYEANTPNREDAHLEIDYSGLTATITTHASLYSTSTNAVDYAAPGAITQTYTWNSTGTLVSMTNPNAPSQVWAYEYYDQYRNLLKKETPPAGATKEYTYNNRGNVTTETVKADGEPDRTTSYTYPDSDPGVPGFIDAQVATDADDGYDANTTLHTTDYYYQAIGHGTAVDKAGWRFANIQIPKGATVTSARFVVCAYDSPWGDLAGLNTELGMEVTPNSPAWAQNGHEPRTASMTASRVLNWRPDSGDWTAGKWVYLPEGHLDDEDAFQQSVQQVVDLSGWASGNAMTVLWRDDGTTAYGHLVNTFDKKSGAGGHLLISYTRDVDPDPNRDVPKTVTAPNDQVTEYSYDDHGNLTKVRSQVSSTEWAETQYSYGTVKVGTATYYGACTQAKSLIATLPLGQHEIKIEATGTKNPAASNTVIGIDAIDQYGANGQVSFRAEQDLLGYNGTWSANQPGGYASGGSFSSTATSGAYMDISWNTGMLAWIGQKHAAYGIAKVTVDNGDPTLVDLYDASTTGLWQQNLWETGTWATTDYGTGGYSPAGQPLKTVSRDVDLNDGAVDHLDVSSTSSYDPFGNVLTTTDNDGHITLTNTYDLAGRLSTSTGPLFTPDGTGTPTQVVSHFFYDPWGHVIESYKTSTQVGQAPKTDWTTTSYDLAGRVQEVQHWLSTSASDLDPKPQSTFYTYDGLGRQVKADNWTVTGLPAYTVYDASGNVVASWAEGACEGPNYDIAKAARSVHDETGPPAGDNSPAFDALGRALRTTAPGSTKATIYEYTADGRVAKQTSPDGTWVRYYYDKMGNVLHTMTSASSPQYLTTATYDRGGRCLTATVNDAGGNPEFTTTYVYDLLGRQTSATTGAGTSYFTYNCLGWKLKIQDADQYTTTHKYDYAGRTVSETTGGPTAGLETTFTYNAVSGLLLNTDQAQESRHTVLTYDSFGRINHQTQSANGSTCSNVTTLYDSLGRVVDSNDITRYIHHVFSYPKDGDAELKTTDTVTTGEDDPVTAVITVGGDGLEANRVSTMGAVTVTRDIAPRDNAKRVTQATRPHGTDHRPRGSVELRLHQWWAPRAAIGRGLCEQSRRPRRLYLRFGKRTQDP